MSKQEAVEQISEGTRVAEKQTLSPSEGGGAGGHHGCVCPQSLPETEGDQREGQSSEIFHQEGRQPSRNVVHLERWSLGPGGDRSSQAWCSREGRGLLRSDDGRRRTQPSCRAHVTHDPRVGALQHLQVADTPALWPLWPGTPLGVFPGRSPSASRQPPPLPPSSPAGAWHPEGPQSGPEWSLWQ